MTEDQIEGHSGELAVAVARAHGVETMFTLSGAHVFPMYDGAVKADPPMRLLDVRHEQTAAFAAEATGKLTRVPGLAVLTAGPGVTNGVSAIAQAQFAGSPARGGRRPRAAEPLGQRQPAGARPAADRRLGVEARRHAADGGRRAAGHGPRVPHGGLLPPRAGVRRRADGRVLQLLVRLDPRRARATAAPTPTPTPSTASPGCSPAPRARWSCSAPTCGPTAPRRPRSGSSRAPGCRRSPTAWAAA